MKSAIMMSVAWLFHSFFFAILFTVILFDESPGYFYIPFLFLVSLFDLCLFLQLGLLSNCRMPSLFRRIVVAWPAALIFSASLLTILSVVGLSIITWLPYGSLFYFLPLFLAILGLYQTTFTPSSLKKWEWLRINAPLVSNTFTINSNEAQVIRCRDEVTYVAPGALVHLEKSPSNLRIIQITDPHIGTMMSVERLRKICIQAVEAKPDIVLLTGDFYTVEGYEQSQHVLAEALEPLTQLAPGKLFACTGVRRNLMSRLGLIRCRIMIKNIARMTVWSKILHQSVPNFCLGKRMLSRQVFGSWPPCPS